MAGPTTAPLPASFVLVGFGASNRAVAAALKARGHRVVVTDDRPGADARGAAASLALTLVEAPDDERLATLFADAGAVVPSPGLPDAHPAFAVATRSGIPVYTELDLAAAWDHRPIAAITGTDGKTTVTAMVTAMLRAGGITCVDAGNNDLPLVTAIDDPAPEWFVVEASSFRLGRTHGWAPRVATWLNLAPDHLDVHATHADYEAAKARIWVAQGADDVAVGNLDDAVVAQHLERAPARRISFSISRPDADYRREGRDLVGPAGRLLAVDDLPRTLPHDVSNALAAAATASAAGVDDGAIVRVLHDFGPLPHRVTPVATVGGVTYYDDSKATVPHATLAALRGFESVVLIAGGRNKGLDLTELATGAGHVRAVVAIGDAAGEVAAAFDGQRPVELAGSMEEAVGAAARLARPGDAVLLSPACASFDWYPDYGARGDHFAALVTALATASEETP
jgi:UDP-N-acetylmuramoylalanine--D-glutamate ligase